MTEDANVRTGQCHCGTVRFRVKLTDGFNTRRRCTCSFCRMRGAVAVSADLDGITFISGEEDLSSYRFNTGHAQHFFCATCGIYTHHQRRSNQQQYGVNVACLDGVSPFDFPEVPVLDGVRHPNDVGGPAVKVGTLRFEPVDHGGVNAPRTHPGGSLPGWNRGRSERQVSGGEPTRAGDPLRPQPSGERFPRWSSYLAYCGV